MGVLVECRDLIWWERTAEANPNFISSHSSLQLCYGGSNRFTDGTFAVHEWTEYKRKTKTKTHSTISLLMRMRMKSARFRVILEESKQIHNYLETITKIAPLDWQPTGFHKYYCFIMKRTSPKYSYFEACFRFLLCCLISCHALSSSSLCLFCPPLPFHPWSWWTSPDFRWVQPAKRRSHSC